MMNMHYLVIIMHYSGLKMNKNSNPAFFLRHTEDTARDGTEKSYEEFFYLNRQPPAMARNGLYFLAFGDCHWWKRFRQKVKHDGSWWAFEFITDGDGVFICDNCHYQVRPGDLYIIRPGKSIVTYPGSYGFLHKKCVLLESQLLDYLCSNLASVDVVRSDRSSRLPRIFDTIRDLIISPNDDIQDDLEIQAFTLLVELKRLAMPMQYPLPLCQAINHINATLNQDFDLHRLGQECHISVSTLSRLFHRYLHTSPMNYIIDRRLEHAGKLLKVSNMPLKEVAEKCGYNSTSFFSRAFKKKYGISPATWR